MKILVIIISHEMNVNYINNLMILDDYLKKDENVIVDYCGISSNDDFCNYESMVTFKYKIINSKQQFSKIYDFITQHKNELDYDWYIKTRPDVKLLEPINFDILSNIAINARARIYRGPQKIKYGMSINGEGIWKNIGNCFYDEYEKEIMLDDQIFIFHKNIINIGGFEISDTDKKNDDLNSDVAYFQNEWRHDNHWKSKNIGLNIIGINLLLEKHNSFSGHLNL